MIACIVGGYLLVMFPKTGAITLIVASMWLASKELPQNKKQEREEELPNSVYVSDEQNAYSDSAWTTESLSRASS